MPTAHPRVSAVVERPLYEALEEMARRDRVSLSQKTRDILRSAVELDEDADLAAIVAERRARSRRGFPLAEVKRRYRVR